MSSNTTNALKVIVSALETGQSKGLFSLQDSASIYNAITFIQKTTEDNNQTNNEELQNKLQEFEKMKIALLSKNIELDNIKRNYKNKISDYNNLNENFSKYIKKYGEMSASESDATDSGSDDTANDTNVNVI